MLIDGEGKPIPPDSWGGDLDPIRQTSCRDCGTPIPFGKFCPQHLNAAREKNEGVMQAYRQEHGIDPGQPMDKSLVIPGTTSPERTIDMDAMAAAELERAKAITTPGVELPPPVNHMAPFPEQARPAQAPHPHEPPPQQPEAPLSVIAAAQVGRSGIRRSDDGFLVRQGLMWLGELRTMAEDGKISPAERTDTVRLAAELIYALSAPGT
ncbi:MAG: hypothetical protein KJN79_09395 [Gammaproteobacteria bacterium]|nr:hypothetical protein [Gammaproteobacteria bacterium]